MRYFFLTFILCVFSSLCWSEEEWPWSYLGIGETTDTCSTTTVDSLSKYMRIGFGETQGVFQANIEKGYLGYSEIPESVLKNFTSEYKYYVFHYRDTRPATFHGFGGVLVAIEGCVEYAKTSYYDN